MDHHLSRVLAAAFAIGLLAAGCAQKSGSSATAQGWKLGHNEALCFMQKDVGGRPFLMTLMKFGHSKDGGMLEMTFVDRSLQLSSADRTPVDLTFDSGVIDEYGIWKATDAKDPDNTYVVKITTYLLKDIFSVMSKASSLALTAEKKSTSFDLPGFGDAAAALRQCAEDHAVIL